MTSYKVLFFVCICAVSFGHALESNDLGDGSDEKSAIIYDKSEECMKTGAVCTRTEYCPQQERQGAELCGGAAGVTCCSDMPTVMKSCRARGGECVPREDCAGRHAPIFDADCDKMEACCVYV